MIDVNPQQKIQSKQKIHARKAFGSKIFYHYLYETKPTVVLTSNKTSRNSFRQKQFHQLCGLHVILWREYTPRMHKSQLNQQNN